MSESEKPKTIGSATSAPNAMAKIRAKKAEIAARITAGELSAEDGSRELRAFQSLSIAHVKEHGAEGA